jgi:hypothetical protein
MAAFEREERKKQNKKIRPGIDIEAVRRRRKTKMWLPAASVRVPQRYELSVR